MSLATKRNPLAGKPTLKVEINGTQLGGFGMDSNGYPFITNSAGTVVWSVPVSSAKSPIAVKVAWTGANNTNVQASIANPFGATCYVGKAWVDVTAADTTTDGTFDVGVAADATTGSDTLIDGGASSAVAVVDSTKDAGTNGVSVQKMTSSQYVTLQGKTGTGKTAGATGTLYVEFWPA